MERTQREAEDAEDAEDTGCSRKTKADEGRRGSPASDGHRHCARTFTHTNTDVQAQLLILEQHLIVW